MLSKRTRLYTNFNFRNFFQVIKSIFFKKKDFNNKLQSFLDTKNIALTSLGRSGLYDIIQIIISSSNKKTFLIAPYTIPAVIHAIKYAGGEVVYIDIDKKTGLINAQKLEEKINNNTAGVIITHLYSNSDCIKEFIKKFQSKVTIIEDAAINFGAKLDDKYLGTLADYGFFSFNIVKNLNTLNGGAIYIKDSHIFEKYMAHRNKKKFPIFHTVNLLITTFIIKILFNNISYQFFHYFLIFVYKKKIKFILKKIYPILFHEYESKVPDIYNYDFNWLMNDVGIYNLEKINIDIEIRKKKASLYQLLINESKAIKTNFNSTENAFLEYVLILKNINNKKAHEILMREGFDIRHTWYINNSNGESNFQKKEFEDTYFLESNIFCLPLHKNISENDIKKISNIINKSF